MTAEEKTDKDRRRYAAWRATLSPEWRRAAHMPDFDVVVNAVPGKCYQYFCSQCRSVGNVARFKEAPCSKAPGRVRGRGLEQWRVEVLGFNAFRIRKLREKNRVDQQALRRTDKHKLKDKLRGQRRTAEARAWRAASSS
jgi:hypothetical protein